MAAWSALSNDPSPLAALPRGGCHYCDLSLGPGAPVCPCQRFYLDCSRQDARHGSEQAIFCFCGHHACFHGFDRPLENEPRTQTTVMLDHAPEHVPIQRDQPFTADAIQSRQSSGQLQSELARASPAISSRPLSHPSIWAAFNAYARQNASGNLPGSSALASTASPSVPSTHPIESSHILPGHVQPYDHLPYVDRGTIAVHDQLDKQYSPMTPTAVNTPSLQGSPLIVQSSSRQPNRPDDRTGALPPTSNGPATQQDYGISLRELQNMTISNASRLNALESLSYSHVPLDEVEDKFQALDCRLSALEEFRADVDTRLSLLSQETKSAATAKKTSQFSTEASSSFSSESSLDQALQSPPSPALSATAAVYAEYTGRFEGLEQKIESMSNSFPSLSNPWQVEIVLLPWGRHLPGIWSKPPTGSKADRMQRRHCRDEWNESNSANHSMFGESFSDKGGWSSDSIQAWADSTSDWLSPKACGPDSLVWKRLWSRGLIQTIEVDSTDAFTFMQRCREAFNHLIDLNHAKDQAFLSLRPEYDALREPLVPLRKVRKISRLQLLAPSEMVTSATWTPSLLDSSVFMKARGLRRLYVTFPESYIQRAGDGWTWQYIRNLRPVRHASPRLGPGFDGPDRSRDYDSCWNMHATLDAPPPASLSFVSTGSDRRSRRESKGSTSNVIDDNVLRHDIPALLVSPTSEGRTLRKGRRRTDSASSLAQLEVLAAGPSTKRRHSQSKATNNDAKRRRLSEASAAVKPGPAATPSLSREPSLPFTVEGPTDNSSDRSRVRRAFNTPLAYATPHSHHIHTISTVRLTDRDGDTDAFTEISPRDMSPFRAEEEWQGMGDDAQASLHDCSEGLEDEDEQSGFGDRLDIATQH